MKTKKLGAAALLLTCALLCGRASFASAETFNLETATIADIQAAIDAGVLSSERLVELYLKRIEAYDKSGPAINAIITINPKALETARALDEERRSKGPRSLLHGIPVVLKDNIDTADLPTTGGSKALENTYPLDDAFVTKKLVEGGAIIIAKTNMDELARGSVGLSSLGGQTLNPYDLERIPGGSSAGTGAAVSAYFAAAGLGTETGVSIRNPATNNGIVGIAPTEGLVSRDGVIPISFTQDRVGPHGRTVHDAAIVLSVIAGFDTADLTTHQSLGHFPSRDAGGLSQALLMMGGLSQANRFDWRVDCPPLRFEDGLKGARIGILRDMFRSGPDHEESLSLIETAISDLKKQGALCVDPVTSGLDLLDILRDARVSDWEFRAALDFYLKSRGPDSLVKNVQEMLSFGKTLPHLERLLSDSLEKKAVGLEPEHIARLEGRQMLRRTLIELMDTYRLDALVYPMKTIPATPIGERHKEADNALSSCSGLPAIVVPAGFTADGLPVSIEFLGRPFDEPVLIRLAYAYEQATLHRKTPSTTPPLPGETIEH